MNTAIQDPPSSDASALDRVLNDVAAVNQAAEQILWDLAPGEIPTPAQRNILRLAGIVDHNDLDRERGRVLSVRAALQRAGSRDEYLAAAKESIEAAQIEAEKRPALEAELEETKAKLHELQQSRLAAAQKLSSMENARVHLAIEALLPRYVWENYQGLRWRVTGNTRGKRIGELTRRIELIDALQKIPSDPDGFKQARLHCEAIELMDPSELTEYELSARHLINRKTSTTPGAQNQGTRETLDWSGFSGYRNRRLKEERPKLERELIDLRQQQSAEVDELESQLNYYISRL